MPLLLDDGSRGYVQSGGVLEQLDGGGASTATYPLADALGSIRGIANVSSAVAGSADYDVFGAVRAKTAAASVFGFTGEQTDTTALTYLRARYLSPAIGRFLSLDSVQPNWVGSQGYNTYTYAQNNPALLTDPSGRYVAENGGLGTISAKESAALGATGFIVNLTLFRILLAIGIGGGGSIFLTPSGPLPTQPPAVTNAKISTKKDITTSVTLSTLKGAMTLADAIDIAKRRYSGSPYVAVDATVIISAVGKSATPEAQAAVDAALAQRPPVVSPQAEEEFSRKNDVGALHHWFNVRGGGQGQPASDAEANALMGVAQVVGKPGLKIGDAKVAISAMKQFLPIMTGDDDLYSFLNDYLHYPAEHRVFD
jgi:RHS repeat-associated protein